MKYETERVASFHNAFGEPSATPRDNVMPDRFPLRSALLVEEIKETVAAMNADDFVELLDGLVDVAFVAAGSADQLALDPASKIKVRAEKMLGDVMQELVMAAQQQSFDVFEEALAELEIIYRGICSIYGFPFMAAFEEVLRSNMSKRNPDGTITRREDGKIIKPETYSPADLKLVLERNGWARQRINL